jgi:hypothetical protein
VRIYPRWRHIAIDVFGGTPSDVRRPFTTLGTVVIHLEVDAGYRLALLACFLLCR